MRNEFWENKRVFITGYEGFLGSWLARTLLAQKANIIGLDILTRRKKTILSRKELARIKIIKGSVENFSLISKIVKENKVEFIFHLAAKSLVGYCLDNPLKGFSTNIKGTWNILEACRGKDLKFLKGIIIASSDKAYGSHKNLPYKESFSLAGIHPYDVSKSCADLLANTYFYTYKLPLCVTRCGNVFGPGDFNFSRVIPDTIRTSIKDKRLLIRSNGKYVRDYIYVKDVIGGYLTLGEAMIKSRVLGESFNFSNERPLSVLEVVKLIYRLMDKKPNYEVLNHARYEIKRQYLSSGKAKRLLGWKPRSALEDGLRETIAWYREHLGRKNHDRRG